MKTLLKVLGILLGALIIATQVFAVEWHRSPSLGSPALLVGDLRFYAPWQGVQWCWWWCASSPRLFRWAGVACGVTLLLCGSLWMYAALLAARQGAAAGFATPRQLRQAKALRKEGIVVGKQS